MSTGFNGASRRRVSLLTSSSLVATLVLSGVATLSTVLAPSAAMAVPACSQPAGTYLAPNASTGGTITCPPLTTGSIGFTSAGVDTNLNLDSGVVVNAGGVLLTAPSAQNLNVSIVTGAAGGSINATGSGEHGIVVSSGGGNVSVNTGTTGYSVTGAGFGVLAATSGAGTATVLGSGPVIGGAGGSGIGAFNTTGTGAVSVGQAGNAYAGAATGGQYGISVSGGGAASVYTSANATGLAAMGIGASSVGVGGAVTVNATGGTVSGVTGGIGASATNANTVTITSGDIITTTGGNGIGASSASGAISVTSTGASISAATFGIGVGTTGAITVVNSSAVTGVTTGGIGVGGPAATGAISVTNTGDFSALKNAQYGVGVRSSTGQITINNSGNVGATGAGNGVDNFGVGGQSVGANTTGVSVTNSGAVFVDGTVALNTIAGVSALNAGTGAVSVVNSGAVTVAGGPALLATGGGNVSVGNTGAVSGDTGIHADSTSGLAAATVSVTGTGAATGTVGNGIEVSTSGSGAVSVGTSAAAYSGAVKGATNGIAANAGSGTVSVYASGAITGVTGYGIQAHNSGSGALTVNSAGAITAALDGVHVSNTGSGAINVSAEGNITAGQEGVHAFTNGTGTMTVGYGDLGGTQTLVASNGAGVHVVDTNSAGVAIVNVGKIGNSGTTTVTAPTAGVQLFSRGSGTVNLGDKVVIDPDNYGVYAVTLGTTVVTSGANDSITVDDNVVAGNDDKNYGVYAASSANADAAVATPSVQVALGTGNHITVTDGNDGQADGGLGIAAINTGSGTGSVSVSAGNGLAIAVTGNNAGGIGASTTPYGGGTGSGNVTVTTGTGTITVAGGATATDTAHNFPGSFGIAALTNGGNVVVNSGANISVSNNAPGANLEDGVLGQTNGAGSVAITTSGTVTVAGTAAIGIAATSGTGGASVTVNGALTSAGRGVVINSPTNGAVTVGAAGSIRGLGDAAHPVVDITTGTGTANTTTVTNNGLIASTKATTVLQAADTAIKAVGGNLTVNNSATGTINGLINVAGLTTAGAATAVATINNAGIWNLTGTETLTAGADKISNTGTINTFGTTTFDLGAGANTFSNGGTIVVGGAGQAAASLHVNNVAVIANSGTIDLHDGLTNRSLVTASTLNGTGAGTLYVDAALGATGGTASAVTIGGSTGLTNIRINNTAAVGAYIPTAAQGIVLVTGATSLANFQLSALSTNANGLDIPTGAGPNAIAAPGSFFYDLAINGNQIVLVSAPKVSSLQFAQIGGIAGDTWATTTQSWFDRQADLRDTLGADGIGSQPAVWMKITGDWTRRNSGETVTVAGKTYGYDTSYRGDTAAVIAGVDLLRSSSKGQAFVVGVQGGYVDANEQFRNSATRLNLTGGVVGVYGTFVHDGLFIDGIVNGNILTANWNLPGLAGAGVAPFVASDHVNTWGAHLEAGYAIPLGANSFVEPLGSIAYGRTTTGQLNLLLGTTQTFADADTLRGSLGGRIGTTAAFDHYKVKVAIEGRVWDEFDGKTNTLMTDAGSPFSNSNDIHGVYGEIKGEANLFAVGNNLSAFVNTGIKWKSNYQDTSVSLGMRYQW